MTYLPWPLTMTNDSGQWLGFAKNTYQSINQSTKEGNGKPAGNAIIEEYIIPVKMIQEYISINVWLEIMIIGAGNAIMVAVAATLADGCGQRDKSRLDLSSSDAAKTKQCRTKS